MVEITLLLQQRGRFRPVAVPAREWPEVWRKYWRQAPRFESTPICVETCLAAASDIAAVAVAEAVGWLGLLGVVGSTLKEAAGA